MFSVQGRIKFSFPLKQKQWADTSG